MERETEIWKEKLAEFLFNGDKEKANQLLVLIESFVDPALPPEFNRVMVLPEDDCMWCTEGGECLFYMPDSMFLCKGMCQNYQEKEQPVKKEKAVVLDIDGVILDTGIVFREIYSLSLKGEAMWNYFYENCNSPKVPFMDSILPFLNGLDPSTKIILSTARNNKCRQSTEERLRRENFHYDMLYMRNINDFRPSPEVKKDHLAEISEKFEIVAFIDDDLSNCHMAKKEGILALQRV